MCKILTIKKRGVTAQNWAGCLHLLMSAKTAGRGVNLGKVRGKVRTQLIQGLMQTEKPWVEPRGRGKKEEEQQERLVWLALGSII